VSTLRLNSDGDLDIANGKTSILNKDGSEVVEETAQRLTLKLRSVLGEWFLDPRVGFPLFENFLTKNPSVTAMRETLRETVVGDEQVDTLPLLSLDLDSASRRLTATFTAELLDGQALEFKDFILAENL
jgi:hypothetical protein